MTNWTESLLMIAASNTLVAGGIAVLALLASRVLRSPTIAHCLWVVVLLKLVTPPLFEVAILPEWTTTTPSVPLPLAATGAESLALPTGHSGYSGDAYPREAIVRRAPAKPGTEATPVSWSEFALFVWLLGTALTLGTGLFRAACFHRSLRHAQPASDAVRREASRLGRRLGLRRTPEIKILPGRLSPMLWGFFGRAQVLLPELLQETLTPDQKRTLLAHELAHLQRRDHWIRVLELIVRALHWWNPLAIFASRELRTVEEECCDAWVVWALPDDSRNYADALLHTVEFLSDATDVIPAPASGIGRVTNLKRRLIMIMQGNHSHSLNRLSRFAVFGLAAITLPLVPAFAQDVEPEHRHEAARRQHDGVDKNQVMRALKRAIHLLKENDHVRDAEVLLVLAKKVQGSDHRAAATGARRAAPHTHELKAVEKRIAEAADQLHEAKAKGMADKARALHQHMRELEKHAHALHRAHAEQQRVHEEREVVREARRNRDRDLARVREPNSDDRVRRLEEQVAHLTQLVERLAHATERKNGDRRREQDRDRDRRRESVDVEEEETEEIEKAAEIEATKESERTKADEARAKRDAESKRRRERERQRRRRGR